MSHYDITVFYSDDDNGYIADVPDLESCSAFGETPEEAVRAVEEARVIWLDAAKAIGREVPRPRRRLQSG